MRTIALLLWLVSVAKATQTTHLFLPGYGGAGGSKFHSWDGSPSPGIFDPPTTDDQLWCWRIPVRLGITNATKVAGAGTNVTGVLGFGLYPDGDGSTAYATMSATGTGNGSAQIVSATVAAFTLTQGAMVRVCTCKSIFSYWGDATTYTAQVDHNTQGEGSVYNVASTFNAQTTRMAKAANTCTAGVPPPTTGALGAAIHSWPPILVLE